MDWYKHDIGAYRRATSRLKLLAHGAYRLLLDEYYSGQGPLPEDYVTLYRICGAQTEAEKTVVRTIADQYFPRNGDGFRHNERADQELSEYQARRVTNKAIAQARIAQRNVDRDVARNVAPETQRFVPTNKETNKQRNIERCSFYLKTGEQCDKEAVGKTNNQNHCREHDPYARQKADT